MSRSTNGWEIGKWGTVFTSNTSSIRRLAFHRWNLNSGSLSLLRYFGEPAPRIARLNIRQSDGPSTAPTWTPKPWTRGLELEKQLRADNYERAVILAKGMIRDDVENRGDAFDLAVVGYVSSMIELGKADAVANLFESLRPGISAVEYVPRGRKEGTMRLMLVQALVHLGSFDTANLILDSLMARMDRDGTEWRDNDYVMATIAAAQGDRKSAIDYVLKDFDQPLGRQMSWSFSYQHLAWLKPLLKDARVAKRIVEREVETQAAGDEVRVMLMEQRAEKG
jgi:hypothetical protein